MKDKGNKGLIKKSMSNSRCTRRNFLKKACGIAAATSLAGSNLLQPASIIAAVLTPRPITIGIFGPSHCAAPVVFTHLKGLFKKEHLNVNLINYPDMSLIARDLINGKLDFGQLVVPLAFALHTGANPFSVKTPVVIPYICGTNGAALMVRKGSGIIHPSDFRGKTVVNHSKLSVHFLINMMFLEKQGLYYAKDVRFKVIELDKVADAMKGGEIDSFVMPEPKGAMVEQAGIGDIYMLSKYIWPNHPCCALVARKTYFEKNRESASSVYRALARGGLMAHEASAREELVDLLRSTPGFKYDRVPRQVLLNAFTPGRSDFYPFPYQSTARVIIEIMKRYRLLPKETHDQKLAYEIFLTDYARKVMEEIGAHPPKSNYRAEKILGQLKEYTR
jgi:nitrate/nitrite transport system substrate-binding protein